MNIFKKLFRTRTFYNSIFSVFDSLFMPLVLLVATPYFIHQLGTEQYGIWMLVNSIVASFGIINIGLGDAIIKFVSKYRGLHDDNRIERIVNVGLSVTLSISLVLISVVSVLSWLLPTEWLQFAVLRNLSGMSFVRLAALIFGFKLIEQFFFSILKGYEKYYYSSILSVLSKSALLLVQFFTAAVTKSLSDLLLNTVYISLGILFVEYFILSRYQPKFRFRLSFEKEIFREIFGFSAFAWIQSILSIMAGQIDRFIVVSFTSATILTYYTLGANIGGQFHMILVAATAWMFPRVSSTIEKGNSVLPLYLKTSKAVSGFGLLGIPLLYLGFRTVFPYWLGKTIFIEAQLYIHLFLLLTQINLLSIAPYFYFVGSNRIRLATLIMFISLLLTLGSMTVGYYALGPQGLVYGKLFSSILSVPLAVIVTHRSLFPHTMVRQSILALAPSFCMVAALYFSGIHSILLALGAYSLYFFDIWYNRSLLKEN